MKLSDVLTKEQIFTDLHSSTKSEVLRELSRLISNAGAPIEADDIEGILAAREFLSSTAIEGGVAIPHGKSDKLPKTLLAIGKSNAGIDLSSIDGRLTHLFFVLIMPPSNTSDHLKILAKISRIVQNKDTVNALLRTETPDEAYRILCAADKEV